VPYAGDDPLEVYAVSSLVTSVSNDAAECIEPLTLES
jgi:hypothetical protein